MKFTTIEDIEAPVAWVFKTICNFDGYERAAMRRGAEVQRMDYMDNGMAWKAAFDMRGKRREVDVKMVPFDATNELNIFLTSTGLDGLGHVELLALSRNRTRLTAEFEIKPTNLSARLLVQSMKLAKTSLTKRFKLRAALHAKDLEDRYKSST
ncbi:SRPBCC family protein [Pseudosulfitobacter sp. SM2401]|uniref:SRPBCC family protein n=1 Tax=Pseudosulfitobacter sp. SM2401 TaxID=3350098 RepID=UPI0036F272D2